TPSPASACQPVGWLRERFSKEPLRRRLAWAGAIVSRQPASERRRPAAGRQGIMPFRIQIRGGGPLRLITQRLALSAQKSEKGRLRKRRRPAYPNNGCAYGFLVGARMSV